MKTFAPSLCLCLGLFLRAQADPLLQEKDRLAVCGDGTANPSWSAYVETYLLTSSPPRVIVKDFSGMPATATDFVPHLQNGLAAFKPTVALACLGANEGDDSGGSAYRRRETDLVEALKKSGARAIVVGSPSCVDSSLYQNDPAKAAVANKALGALADISKDVAKQKGVVYADVFGATTDAMTKAKATFGEKYPFDTGRPGSPSSIVTAYAFLKALGCQGNMGSAEVENLETGRAKFSHGQWYTFQDHTYTCESSVIPFNFYRWMGPGPDQDILRCVPFDDELNRYILTVKNLTCTQAKVTWGKEDHDFSAAQLATGINLPKEFYHSPYQALFDNLSRITLAKQEQERAANLVGTDAGAKAAWDQLLQDTLTSFVNVGRHGERQTINIQPLATLDPWPKGPIPVILDTDIDADVDDVGALALLNSFMDQGEAKLLACVHDTMNVEQSSCATMQAINAYYGHPSIPIGQAFGDKGPAVPMTSKLDPAPPLPDAYHRVGGVDHSSYAGIIHQQFDPEFPSDDKMPAGVDVYRKALAGAEDHSVVICSVGTMENIQDLIQSQPDSVSNLSGLDLVSKKVRYLVVMANTQPQDNYVLSKWPTKIMWTTYVGSNIGTGPSLLATPENNPVRAAYDHYGVLHTGRQSWDLTAAWLAVRGPGDVFDAVAGRPHYIDVITHSVVAPHPGECEVTVKMPYPEVSKLIGVQLALPPKP